MGWVVLPSRARSSPNAPRDAGEFEAVAREAAGEVHSVALRVAVDDEMAVG